MSAQAERARIREDSRRDVQALVLGGQRRVELEAPARVHGAGDEEVHADGRVRVRARLDLLRVGHGYQHWRGERRKTAKHRAMLSNSGYRISRSALPPSRRLAVDDDAIGL